jgi:hypothetical protein
MGIFRQKRFSICPQFIRACLNASFFRLVRSERAHLPCRGAKCINDWFLGRFVPKPRLFHKLFNTTVENYREKLFFVGRIWKLRR